MDEQSKQRGRQPLLWLVLLLVLAGAVAALLRLRSRSALRKPRPSVSPPLDLTQFQGLSEAEATTRRRPDLEEKRQLEAKKVRRDIWRFSTFSIFNLSMLGLAAVQAVLGDPLSALLTFAILIINIAVNAAQQLYATGRIEKLLDQARPIPTAIRDGRLRSIDVDDVVAGDLLVIGPGDEFLADGKLLTGRPKVIEPGGGGHDRVTLKREGDLIRAGSFCVQDRAVYTVTRSPDEDEASTWTPVQKRSQFTPLQRIISRVLIVLLLAIAIFLGLLFLDLAKWPILGQLFERIYREAASILFSIAPSGLFFMVVATYAIGSARLADLGALIRDSRAVESLAQISVLCFSKTGALTGAEVSLEMIPWENDQPALAESRVRQILGDLAISSRSDNVFLKAIGDSFGGAIRQVDQAAWFLSAYGWSAVTFTDADLRATYVLGEPAILNPQLATVGVASEDTVQDALGDESGRPAGVRRLFASISGLLRPSRQEQEEGEAGQEELPTNISVENKKSGQAKEAELDNGDASSEQDRGFLQKMQARAATLFQRDDEDEDEKAAKPERIRAPQLLFAYTPEPQSVIGPDGRPLLPNGLTPLCHLTFEEQIRPEARESIRAFTDAGVAIKILSSDEIEPVSGAAEQLGLIEKDSAAETALSGSELASMDQGQFGPAITGATIFGRLTSDQKGEVVRALQRQGERVAMVGDGVEDIAAMEAANLSITLGRGSQAAVSSADIVLLEDSLEVLPTVLERGQRMVNGMLDIMKINLSQVSYVLLLLIVMFAAGRRMFFYHPTQGGVIAFFTVIVPTVSLTLWASAGPLPRQYMRSRMVHFVLPAAITMAIAALVTGLIFGRNLGDIAYSRLAVTHLLILIGLILVVFVQPPTRFWVGGDVLSGDWRNTYVAIGLLLLFIAATYLPLTQTLLRLAPLESIFDYLVIAAVALVWLFILRSFWRARWLSRYVGIFSEQLER